MNARQPTSPESEEPEPDKSEPDEPDPGKPGPEEPEGDVAVTVYEALGGQPFFDHLVERFYARVATDETLLPLYPEQDDLGPARQRLSLFLGQYWGGPTAYSELRGHPRLRMRHVPFLIGTIERDHWVAAMNESLTETIGEAPLDEGLRAEVLERMSEYFAMAADHLVNQPES